MSNMTFEEAYIGWLAYMAPDDSGELALSIISRRVGVFREHSIDEFGETMERMLKYIGEVGFGEFIVEAVDIIPKERKSNVLANIADVYFGRKRVTRDSGMKLGITMADILDMEDSEYRPELSVMYEKNLPPELNEEDKRWAFAEVSRVTDFSIEEAFIASLLYVLMVEGDEGNLAGITFELIKKRLSVFEKYSAEELDAMVNKMIQYDKKGLFAIAFAGIPLKLKKCAYTNALDMLFSEDLTMPRMVEVGEIAGMLAFGMKKAEWKQIHDVIWDKNDVRVRV